MVHLVCDACGEGFETFPCKVRTGKKYCSRRCKGIASRGRPLRGTLEERLWSRVDKSGDCWIWTGSRTPQGYGRIGVMGIRDPQGTHRVAYELTYGPIPPGKFVLHSCDNRACCNPAHLRVGTVQDNANDMTQRVRQARGNRHGSAKLKPQEVRAIRLALPMSTLTEIGRRYGVSPRTIGDIRDSKTWSWLT